MMNEKDYDFNTSSTFHVYWPNVNDSFELNVIECGYEHCEPLHICGPIVKERPYDGRKYNLIKYISDGKGTVIYGGRKYSLQKGDGFFVPVGHEITYISDEREPWSYQWLGFIGIKADLFMSETTIPDDIVFHCEDGTKLSNLLLKIYEASQTSDSAVSRECVMLSHAYAVFAELLRMFPQNDVEDDEADNRKFIKKAVDYLQRNYLSKYSVSDLAKDIGFSRSYIYKLFDRYLKMPPATYVKKYRISRACELLKSSELSIEKIAFSTARRQRSRFFGTGKMFSICCMKSKIPVCMPNHLTRGNVTRLFLLPTGTTGKTDRARAAGMSAFSTTQVPEWELHTIMPPKLRKPVSLLRSSS